MAAVMNLFRSRPQPRHAPTEPAMAVRLLPAGESPPPSPQAAAMVYATLTYLTAETAWLAQRGQLARVDEAARAREAGERLPPGGTVTGITRKAAAMLRHCPPCALPPPAARIRWLEREQ